MLRRDLIDGILAGMMVSFGGAVLLSCDSRYVGAGLFSIALLSICIVAISSKYDAVQENKGEKVEPKYSLFYGGEDTVFSQVGGGDLFWGFKHNWRHYFSFMHDLHSGIVNDYALWAVIALALAILYALIVM